MERELSILLVEDDTQACEDIAAYIDTLDDVVLTAITNNASKAEQLIQDTLPDAVILDLELHGGSGSGLSLLRALHGTPPAKMPYILITTNNSSAVTYDAARQLGTDFILFKHQNDYSAQSVVEFLRALKHVIQKHHASHAQINQGQDSLESPAQMDRRITRRICLELDRVGISAKAKGYQYLTDAILLVTKAPTPNLCAIIGQKYGKTESSVERAMQNAIAKAWRTTPIDDLLAYYTAKISSEKGVPTITEFVCHYANKLKNEG